MGIVGEGLTRLKVEVHTRDDGSRSLTVSFLVNKQQLLIEDFEAAAHDTILRVAHNRGHMPIGPILIRVEECEPVEQKPLEEGKPMLRSFEDYALDAAIMRGDIAQVIGEVELGLSLD